MRKFVAVLLAGLGFAPAMLAFFCLVAGGIGLLGGLADTSVWENQVLGMQLLGTSAVMMLAAAGMWYAAAVLARKD